MIMLKLLVSASSLVQAVQIHADSTVASPTSNFSLTKHYQNYLGDIQDRYDFDKGQVPSVIATSSSVHGSSTQVAKLSLMSDKKPMHGGQAVVFFLEANDKTKYVLKVYCKAQGEITRNPESYHFQEPATAYFTDVFFPNLIGDTKHITKPVAHTKGNLPGIEHILREAGENYGSINEDTIVLEDNLLPSAFDGSLIEHIENELQMPLPRKGDITSGIFKYPMVLLPFAENGDMYDLICDEDRTRDFISGDGFLRTLRAGLQTLLNMHEKNVLHCDVKPENTFIDADNNLVFGDFGIAKIKSHETILNGGSYEYVPPQFINIYEEDCACVLDNVHVNEAFDFYAFGATMFSLAGAFLLTDSVGLRKEIDEEYFWDPDYEFVASEFNERWHADFQQDVLDDPFFEDVNHHELITKVLKALLDQKEVFSGPTTSEVKSLVDEMNGVLGNSLTSPQTPVSRKCYLKDVKKTSKRSSQI